jgi:hypothetical protein
MTPRLAFASKRRPLSAIFLGADPAPSTSDLPDLPEPPSPGASSTHSGLPSPPATNSTGSGSTGDSRENIDRPVLSPPTSTLTMRNEKPPNARSSRTSSPAGSGGSKRDEGDEEEDNTARLNLGRRSGASQSTDHVMTLQRVMSLTQRNRMVSASLLSCRSRSYVCLARLRFFPSVLSPPSPRIGPQQTLFYAPQHTVPIPIISLLTFFSSPHYYATIKFASIGLYQHPLSIGRTRFTVRV